MDRAILSSKERIQTAKIMLYCSSKFRDLIISEQRNLAPSESTNRSRKVTFNSKCESRIEATRARNSSSGYVRKPVKVQFNTAFIFSAEMEAFNLNQITYLRKKSVPNNNCKQSRSMARYILVVTRKSIP